MAHVLWTTSCDVNSPQPSWNWMPCRSLKFQDMPSGAMVHSVASSGMKPPVFRSTPMRKSMATRLSIMSGRAPSQNTLVCFGVGGKDMISRFTGAPHNTDSWSGPRSRRCPWGWRCGRIRWHRRWGGRRWHWRCRWQRGLARTGALRPLRPCRPRISLSPGGPEGPSTPVFPLSPAGPEGPAGPTSPEHATASRTTASIGPINNPCLRSHLNVILLLLLGFPL